MKTHNKIIFAFSLIICSGFLLSETKAGPVVLCTIDDGPQAGLVVDSSYCSDLPPLTGCNHTGTCRPPPSNDDGGGWDNDGDGRADNSRPPSRDARPARSGTDSRNR